MIAGKWEGMAIPAPIYSCPPCKKQKAHLSRHVFSARDTLPCTAAARAPHIIVNLDLTLKRLISKRVRQIKIRYPELVLPPGQG